MNAYIALTRTYLRLTMRDRAALFFSYLLPMVFFFMFSEMMHAERGTAVVVVNMVLTIGILGTGLFGAGMRATLDRETNILRRFKVAPISPAPILVASLVVGLFNFAPIYVLVLVLSNRMYGMPLPSNLVSLTVFVFAGVLAFRAIGLMVAAVANSTQESQILIQSLYMPMLFLSGATIPLSIMPEWVQIVGQFLPATHLFTGMNAIMAGGQSLAGNLVPLFALTLTVILGGFLGVKLFRWEKGEKLPASSKLWVLGVLAPFVVMGVHQAYSKENVAKNRILQRELSRNVAFVIRNVRIFTGDAVIENGSVLLRNGKIAEVFRSEAPDAKSLRATDIEGAGKTLLPGLIDVHVHLAAPGGLLEKQSDYKPRSWMKHALAAYLYSGVTAVKSAGDPLDSVLEQRAEIRSGNQLGAELFVSGPLITAEGGHGTEFLRGDFLARLPESARKMMAEDVVRTPRSAEEARKVVDDLNGRGVDAIKAVMEAGGPGMPFRRMDPGVLRAIVAEAHGLRLPVSVHTGDVQDVRDAIAARADSVEHGSMRQIIPGDVFDRMKAGGVVYDPTLAVLEGVLSAAARKTDPIDRSLVEQVGPASLIRGTRAALRAGEFSQIQQSVSALGLSMPTATQNLVAAWRHGVTLATGTDAGNLLTFHGPAVHREMQLWVEAGVPPLVALQAATANAAHLLKADDRIGFVRKGYEATLLLVDGDPTKEISATERISSVFFKGERIDRQSLVHDEK